MIENETVKMKMAAEDSFLPTIYFVEMKKIQTIFCRPICPALCFFVSTTGNWLARLAQVFFSGKAP